MASVIPKPNGTYLIRISCGLDSSGKQIAKSKTFRPSKPNLSFQKLNKEIENFIAAFEEEARSDNPTIRFDKITFKDFCPKYLELKKTVLSPNSYAFYETIINTELIPKFGKMKLREIKTYHIQEFIQYLTTEKKHRNGEAGGISPSTVRRYATVLRSILSLAYQLEYTDNDAGASKRIIFPKVETCEVEVYTEEEVRVILSALDAEPINIRALVELAIFTGMRRGEIVGLKWADIDFENQSLSIKRSIYKPKDGKALEKEPKSKSSIRTISLPEHLIKTLLEYKLHQDRHISFMGEAWNITNVMRIHTNNELRHSNHLRL